MVNHFAGVSPAQQRIELYSELFGVFEKTFGIQARPKQPNKCARNMPSDGIDEYRFAAKASRSTASTIL
jgi:hypothetical protein